MLGRRVTLWCRDDDACRDSAPLRRLLGIAQQHRVPVIVAAIPSAVDRTLVDAIACYDAVTIVQHGYAHCNHAPAGERSAELGEHRAPDVRLGELARGRATLTRAFGARFTPLLRRGKRDEVPARIYMKADRHPQLFRRGPEAVVVIQPRERELRIWRHPHHAAHHARLAAALQLFDCVVDVIDRDQPDSVNAVLRHAAIVAEVVVVDAEAFFLQLRVLEMEQVHRLSRVQHLGRQAVPLHFGDAPARVDSRAVDGLIRSAVSRCSDHLRLGRRSRAGLRIPKPTGETLLQIAREPLRP